MEFKTISSELSALYKELDPQRQIVRIHSILDQLTPLDAIYFTRLDLSLSGTTERCVIACRPEPALTATKQQSAQKALLQFPFCACRELVNSERWLNLSAFAKLAYPGHWQECLAILADVSGPKALVCLLGHYGASFYYLTVARWERNFTKAEATVLGQLLPHLRTGFHNALKYGRAASFAVQAEALIGTIPGAFGFCNNQGDFIWLQNRARCWLDEFYPGRKGHHLEVPECIHQQINLCIRNELEHLEMIQERKDVLLKVSIVASETGGWTLHLQRKPIFILENFRPLVQLSRRRNQVLEWLLQGKRNSEIAVILHLSKRTVEKHVAQILIDLEVENRSALAGRVMELWEKQPAAGRK